LFKNHFKKFFSETTQSIWRKPYRNVHCMVKSS